MISGERSFHRLASIKGASALTALLGGIKRNSSPKNEKFLSQQNISGALQQNSIAALSYMPEEAGG